MVMFKRFFLFAALNLLVMFSVQIVYAILVNAGIIPPFSAGIAGLAAYSLVYGMSFAFISLLISKQIAKWVMKVQVIDPQTQDPALRNLVGTVHELARRAGLRTMPEVGIYQSPEINAFATGPSKSNSLVAVSTGLLQRMGSAEIEGVLGHEVAHVANGDMVTMTLIQGVVNAFVIFFARLIATVIGSNVEEKNRYWVELATMFCLELVFMLLGSIVVNYFSRAREFRADTGGAKLAGRERMISALQALKNSTQIAQAQPRNSFSSLKISNPGRINPLFSTHPSLEERIARLQKA